MATSKGKLLFGGVLTYAVAVGAGYTYATYKEKKEGDQIPCCGEVSLNDVDRQKTYSKNASCYDKGML